MLTFTTRILALGVSCSFIHWKPIKWSVHLLKQICLWTNKAWFKQGGSSSHAHVGVSMRGCEGSGQPGGPGVRGHAHQTACGEWLSSSAQRACQSRLIMRRGWICPSTPGWSRPPRPSLHPPLKKRAFAWQSGMDFMKKERKERENEIKNPFGVPQTPIHPKRMDFGNKRKVRKGYPYPSFNLYSSPHNIYPIYYVVAFSLQMSEKVTMLLSNKHNSICWFLEAKRGGSYGLSGGCDHQRCRC